MPTVNSEIRRIIKEKDMAIRSGTQSMLDILKELQTQVLNETGKAALGSWDAYYLKNLLGAIESQIDNFTVKAKAEAAGLLEDSWGKGIAMVDVPLGSAGIYTGFHISTSSLDVLKEFTFHKLDGLSAAAMDKIKAELTLGIIGGKTPAEVAAAIGKNLKDPSIFTSIAARAEVITKTEMGRVFSTANQMRMEQASEYVVGLEKQWRHAGHPKQARPAHLAAHGQHVPVNEPFNIGGVPMMYPRAPGAPLDEVINCGCDHVPYHPRWG